MQAMSSLGRVGWADIVTVQLARQYEVKRCGRLRLQRHRGNSTGRSATTLRSSYTWPNLARLDLSISHPFFYSFTYERLCGAILSPSQSGMATRPAAVSTAAPHSSTESPTPQILVASPSAPVRPDRRSTLRLPPELLLHTIRLAVAPAAKRSPGHAMSLSWEDLQERNSTLCRLALVSRQFRACAQTVLFGSIEVVWCASRVEPLLCVLETNPTLAALVRSLTASVLHRDAFEPSDVELARRHGHQARVRRTTRHARAPPRQHERHTRAEHALLPDYRYRLGTRKDWYRIPYPTYPSQPPPTSPD